MTTQSPRTETATIKRRFPLEAALVLAVAAVWAILAAVYQFTPSLGMPGYARVWGGGALVFLLLALRLLRARSR